MGKKVSSSKLPDPPEPMPGGETMPTPEFLAAQGMNEGEIKSFLGDSLPDALALQNQLHGEPAPAELEPELVPEPLNAPPVTEPVKPPEPVAPPEPVVPQVETPSPEEIRAADFEAERKAYLEQINDLSRQLLQMRAGGIPLPVPPSTGVAPVGSVPAAPPIAPVAPVPQPLPQYVDTSKMDDNEFYEMVNDRQRFEAYLRSRDAALKAEAAKDLQNMTAQMVRENMIIENTFVAHPKLAPFRDAVLYQAQVIAERNPGMDAQAVMDETLKKVIPVYTPQPVGARAGQSQQTPAQNLAATPADAEPAFGKTGSSRKGASGKPTLTPLEEEMAAMDMATRDGFYQS